MGQRRVGKEKTLRPKQSKSALLWKKILDDADEQMIEKKRLLVSASYDAATDLSFNLDRPTGILERSHFGAGVLVSRPIHITLLHLAAKK